MLVSNADRHQALQQSHQRAVGLLMWAVPLPVSHPASPLHVLQPQGHFSKNKLRLREDVLAQGQLVRVQQGQAPGMLGLRLLLLCSVKVPRF